MRHTDQLKDLEFTPSKVKVADWDLRIPIAPKAGPFCQLEVDTSVGAAPGVYAWVVTDKVIYVGHTDDLSLVAHSRGDFTSVSPSSVDSGPAKVNNLINAAFKAEHRISFWWHMEMSPGDAAIAAGELVAEFDPMGNKLTQIKSPEAAPAKATTTKAPAATRTAAPKAKAVKAPTRYDRERIAPKNLVCPSCFIQVPLTTGWCDDCEIKVTG
ncbi:MAG: hypothetical protein Q4G35_00755 [Propionibacteriaceae bacterium]|nr:hypothetical protein [Propionibacteriaceae bacterium]